MLRKIFFISIAVLILFATSYGQDVKKTGGFSRIATLGASPFVVDPFFVTVNPAWGALYNDFILLDIGTTNGAFAAGGVGQYLSGSFSVAKNWTLGAILTRNNFNGFGIALVDPGSVVGQGVVSAVNNNVPGANVLAMDQNLEIMATYKLKKTILGFGFAYAGTSNDFTPATGEGSTNSASQIGFNLGIIQPFSSKFYLDGGVSFMFPSASYKAPVAGSAESTASQTIILVNARGFYKSSKKLTFVPIIAFMTLSGSAETGGTTSTSVDLPSATLFNIGIGSNYVVGDLLMTGGLSFSSISSTTAAVEGGNPELTTSATLFPVWNFGLEWNFIDWLVARLGYAAVTGSATSQSTDGNNPPGLNESVASIFLPTNRGATVGIGLRFGGFSLDAVVNEDILRQGFNTIGGGGATGATFARVSTSYALP